MEEPRDLAADALATWRVNDRGNATLLRAVPRKGLAARPAGSRGRVVAKVLAHRHHVRLAWLRVNGPERVAGLPRFSNVAQPARADLARAFKASGRAVERLRADALAGRKRLSSFKGNPVRFLAYLVAHDAHHRGQIALVLKQHGMKLPDAVALRGLWSTGTSENRERRSVAGRSPLRRSRAVVAQTRVSRRCAAETPPRLR